MSLHIFPLQKRIDRVYTENKFEESDLETFWKYYVSFYLLNANQALGVREMDLLIEILANFDSNKSVFKTPYSDELIKRLNITRPRLVALRRALQDKGLITEGDGKRGDFILPPGLRNFQQTVNKWHKEGKLDEVSFHFNLNIE